MAKNTERHARALAGRIDGDPRADGRYDVHGLNEDERGWYVRVLDSLGTRTHPAGRDLAIRSWNEWEAEAS